MTITCEDVQAAVLDARLSFSREEEEVLKLKIQRALVTMEDLKKEFAARDVPPLFTPLDKDNVFREDKNEESLPREKVLENGPDTDHTCFRVPRIIETQED